MVAMLNEIQKIVLILLVLPSFFFAFIMPYNPFPFSKFLETIYPSDTIQDIDPDIIWDAKANVLCEGNTRSLCCDCNPVCLSARTCCIDYLWDPRNPTPPTLHEYMAMFKKEVGRHPKTECVRVEPFSSFSNLKVSYMYMVSTCSDFTSPYKKFCLNQSLLTDQEKMPVADDVGNLYRNKFCALCNNINYYSMVNITFQCRPPEYGNKSLVGPIYTNFTMLSRLNKASSGEVNLTLMDIVSSKNCEAVTYKSNYAYRCNPNTIRPKSDSYCDRRNHSDFCQLYGSPPDGYQNFHCHACYNNKNNKTFKIDSNFFECLKIQLNNIFTWQMTIDFTEKTANIKTTGQTSQHLTCKEDTHFNVFTNKCERFSCAPGFKANGPTCIKSKRKKVISKYFKDSGNSFARYFVNQNPSIYILMKRNDSLNASHITKMFEKTFNISFRRYSILSKSEDLIVLKRQGSLNFNQLVQIESMKGNKVAISNSVREITISSINITGLSQMYGTDLTRYFDNGRICSQTPAKIGNMSFVDLNHTLSKNISFILNVSNNTIKKEIYECRDFHLQKNCTLINVEPMYYNITNVSSMEISLITNQGFSMTLKPSEYLPHENGIAVCGNVLVNILPTVSITSSPDLLSWRNDFQNAQGYTSLSLSFLSIVSGIIFIAVHTILKELRNRGGRIVLSLSIAILISDILYVAATFSMYNTIICKTVGILLHIFLLVVNNWTIFLVFDLTYQIMKCEVRAADNNGYLMKYVVVTYTPAILIVMVCVALDETGILLFGYGENGVCWINSLNPMLVSYVIPVAFGYMLSLSCCLVLLRHLRQQIYQGKAVLSGNKHTSVIDFTSIATKITVVLGLAEIVGFIQIRKKNLNESELIVNTTFQFLYNILRSSRGFLVSLFYLVNKRTLRLYQKWKRSFDVAQNKSTLTLNSDVSPKNTFKVRETALSQHAE